MGAATDQREGATAIAEATPMVVKDHPALAPALVAALADLTVVHTGRTVNTGSYSYDYADLGDVVKLTRPILAKHGLVALTPVGHHGDGLACTVIFVHTSGELLYLGPFPFPHGRDAQATGSMVTYHRRYALVAALGMASGDDDDGAGAKARQAPAVDLAARAAAKLALAELPEDVAAKIEKDAIARAGAENIDGVLSDDGWRKWVLDAIAYHKAQT